MEGTAVRLRTGRPPVVFVSHANSATPMVRLLLERLETEGVQVNTDFNIAASESFSDGLNRAIDESDIIIVVMTPRYFASPWCQAELATAMATEKRILPVLIAGVVPQPHPLSYIQYIDGRQDYPRFDRVITAIVEALRVAR